MHTVRPRNPQFREKRVERENEPWHALYVGLSLLTEYQILTFKSIHFRRSTYTRPPSCEQGEDFGRDKLLSIQRPIWL